MASQAFEPPYPSVGIHGVLPLRPIHEGPVLPTWYLIVMQLEKAPSRPGWGRG